MRELSIKEKAKRYDEAIEIAKKWRNAPNVDKIPTFANRVIEELFPELKESEDEKIRKWIIDDIRYNMNNELLNNSEYKKKGEKAIAWLQKQGESDETKAKMFLMNKGYPIDANGTFPTYEEIYNIIRDGLEKQGEQKSAEWHKGDEQNLNACLGFIPDEYLRRWLMDVIHVKYDKPTDKVEPKFKNGQSPAEWSEEDNYNLQCMIAKVTSDIQKGNVGRNNESIDWLKSFRHHSHWKPSEEQMEALAEALSLAKNCGEESAFDLRTLYEQLKKLKG